jgi:phosphohistidine phosphatase
MAKRNAIKSRIEQSSPQVEISRDLETMGNQFVTLVRHAKSSWKTQNQDDFDRPLNQRGIQDGPEMARRLVSQQCVPDLLLCSAARRAQDTAAFLYSAFQLKPEQFEVLEELYMASPATLLDALSNVPATVGHVMVVAHNPGLEALSDILAGYTMPPMPTLGVRHFSCPSIRELKSQNIQHVKYSDTHKAHGAAPAILVFDDYPKSTSDDS